MMLLPELTDAQRVSVFLSFGSEIDTRPLIDALWLSGREVYLPRLHPFSPGNLLFLRYAFDTKLIYNAMNIGEPKLDIRSLVPPDKLDVMIIPLLGFDSAGNRIGMGGGYYDRTLQNWQKSRYLPIGLALDCQQVDAIPVESWDIPLPMLVTPSTIWRWASAKR